MKKRVEAADLKRKVPPKVRKSLACYLKRLKYILNIKN